MTILEKSISPHAEEISGITGGWSLGRTVSFWGKRFDNYMIDRFIL